jgi:hypothetical protein
MACRWPILGLAWCDDWSVDLVSRFSYLRLALDYPLLIPANDVHGCDAKIWYGIPALCTVVLE